MKDDDYDAFVASKIKPGATIAHQLDGDGQITLMNALAFASWTGSQIDLVKKRHIYQKTDVEEAQLLAVSDADVAPLKDLSADDCNLIHMILGLVGEACELAEGLFAHLQTGEPLDLVNMVEESGDLDFFHSGFRQALSISRSAALEYNVAKLSKRYKEKYSDAEAVARADKQDEGTADA